MRVLITGFEPFGNDDVNSSWETAVGLAQLSTDGLQINVSKLPVSFERVGEVLRKEIDELKPDLLIMLGQRGNGCSIDLERIAVNMMDSAKGDNDGYVPSELPVCEGGAPAYFSNLPLKAMREAFLDAGIPARISNNAGLYVCNCAYYQALCFVEEMNMHTQVVFVHLPKISEEWPLSKMVEAIRCAILIVKSI